MFVFVDVTHAKLIKTGTALGLSPAAATGKVSKVVQALQGAADALITELEQEFAGFAAQSPQPEAMTTTQGAEAHLLRGLRSIVIAEMLRRVG